MSQGLLAFFTKLGFLSEGMIAPRRLTGLGRRLTAFIAVAFSYFFIHVAFFGQPVAAMFKGTYILGTGVLCILFYKGRRQSFRDGSNILDEFFSLTTTVTSVTLYALWIYWILFQGPDAWDEFMDRGAAVAAIIGAILGVMLYWQEGRRGEIGEGFTISDGLMMFSVIVVIVWWAANQEWLLNNLGSEPSTRLIIFTGLLIAASFDIARRVMGPMIPLIGIVFLLYTYGPIAERFPGVLQHDGFTIGRVAEYSLIAADGMTGLIIEVFATYVVIFILLGAFLEKTGIGAIFIDTTFRLTGQRTGGPGLTAVAASGLFGMISGSGVANVVTTGTFTIPLMKRVGYKPEFAAAVEAAASTGGGYMPPIMGAGAFLLAQFTEVSYLDVIKIAAIPAILYFLSVGYMVYIRAAQRGLHGLPISELPAWSSILPRLYLLLPIPAMVYYLLNGDSAFLAAFKTILLIILLKAVDLLLSIRTHWSMKVGNPFLAVAVLMGLVAYFFGSSLGPPFTWFTPAYRSVSLGDSLFWTLMIFFLLKLGEMICAGFQAPEGGHASGTDGKTEAGPVVFVQLRKCFLEWLKAIWDSLEAGAVNTLVIGCITGVLGIILSSATQSALPGRVSEMLTELSFGLLPLTLFWIIFLGYIVGMGLPIPAAYVILIIFGVVSLTDLDVPTLTAHLICYWVAVVSAVTPPVAISAYAASGIALSDPVKTSFQALKLASWIFIMPFLFVYTPILLVGSWADILVTVLACLLGIVAWGGMLEGFFFQKTSWQERAMLFLASICLLLPLDNLVVFITPLRVEHPYAVYLLGAALLGGVYFMQRGRNAEVQFETP